MKRKIKAALAMVAASLMCCTAFVGCFAENGTPQQYTVQYTDDTGTHQIIVTGGEPYALESVPQRTGYDFLGLFDKEEGGKQYVSAQGASLSVYDDKKNVVLFPQWKAKQYNLILDFQGAEVTASRSVTVEYGASLPQLPLDLELEHKEFCGWYTKENCGGTQIADKFGLLPVVSIVNGDNFDLSQENARINLYAGFTTAKYSVTLNFGSGLGSEKVNVPYGTDIKNVIYNMRNASGQAVLSWSRTQGDTEKLFTGTIEQNTTLYAVEWANTIEFDTDGGERLAPVVARKGAAINLPVPTKNLYKFLNWQDKDGNNSELTVMPSVNTTLKAVWQAKIVFDSNGGESLNDISEKSGVLISLPKAERDGYVFAGWYTTENELYSLETTIKMPSSGILLKAGWYKEKKDTVVLIQSNSAVESTWTKHGSPNFDRLSYTFRFADYFNENKNFNIIIDFHVSLAINQSKPYNIYLDLYSQKQISSNYLIETKSFNNVVNEFKSYDFTSSFTVSDNFYMCWYSNLPQGTPYKFYLQDFYYIVHYPDTNNFYL